MQKLKESIKNVSRGFINPKTDELYYSEKDGNDVHEILARKICEEENFDWRKAGYFSACDYLIMERQWIKISNYNSEAYKYIAVSKTAKDKVIEYAKVLSYMYNLRIEIC